jgi:hypothetical protein
MKAAAYLQAMAAAKACLKDGDISPEEYQQVCRPAVQPPLHHSPC